MRAWLILSLTILAAVPAAADNPASPPYKVELDRQRSRPPYQGNDGKIHVDLTFRVTRQQGVPPAGDGQYRIVIKESGKPAHEVPLQDGSLKDMTLMLLMDISGSMGRPSSSGKTKMAEAQDAGLFFLDKLHAKARVGLMLFDDKIEDHDVIRPIPYEERDKLRTLIRNAKPRGGTAYLDATIKALQLLRNHTGNRAIVLMTDGVDISPERPRKLQQIQQLAAQEKVPVYTIGVGDPGWSEPVTTVLVLDRSGSMRFPLEKPKIASLREAARRFVDLIRAGARSTVLPFSTRVETPEPFTADPEKLKDRIDALQADGGTLLYDATMAGLETLIADRQEGRDRQQPVGQHHLVVFTDGVDEDPGSRHRLEEVIERARAAKIKIYTIGLGSKAEIADTALLKMARETNGEFFHAEDQDRLVAEFEKLSTQLHGDGIDEAALIDLARRTNGKYYRVKDASELKLLYERLADELKETYSVTFPSLSQRMHGSVDPYDVVVMDKSGQVLSNVEKIDLQRKGLLVPEMDYLVYLTGLAGLLFLLWLPAGLKKLNAPATS